MEDIILEVLINCYKTLKETELSIVDTPKDIVTEGDIILGNLIRQNCLKLNVPVCIYTEEFPEGIQNSKNPEYCIFVDELDGTDNAYRDIRLFPSVTLIQIAKASNLEKLKFEDFIAVGAVEHSNGEIYMAEKNKGVNRYYIKPDYSVEKLEKTSKHPKQEVIITDMYSMMQEIDILTAIVTSFQTKDFGASAATYCYVSTGLFEAYVSSHKKGHELPLLYLLCKEAGLQMTDFAGRNYDKIKYDFNSTKYQVIAGKKTTCQALINKLKSFAKNT